MTLKERLIGWITDTLNKRQIDAMEAWCSARGIYPHYNGSDPIPRWKLYMGAIMPVADLAHSREAAYQARFRNQEAAIRSGQEQIEALYPTAHSAMSAEGRRLWEQHLGLPVAAVPDGYPIPTI